MNNILTWLFISEMMKDDVPKDQVQKQEEKSTYLVKLTLVLTALAVLYGACKLIGLPMKPFTEILQFLIYPLHWEFTFLNTTDMYLKGFTIGSTLAMVTLLMMNVLLATIEQSLLNSTSTNNLVNSMLNGVYLLVITVLFWCRMLIPLVAIKLILSGFLWLLEVIVN